MQSLTIIGGGNMGGAIAEAVVQKGIISQEQLSIVEKNAERREFLQKLLGCRVVEAIEELKEKSEAFMIAVKPQYCIPILESLAGYALSETLFISIMAGVKIERMEQHLKPAQVIRVMPNTPCSIGMGMSVYYGGEFVKEESFEFTQKVLDTMGSSFRVDKERMIDASTAISGSGPAYLFYLAESLVLGAEKLGFTHEQARLLAKQTVLGASNLLDKSGESPQELRRKVTSPGGTTAAAIQHLDQKQVRENLVGAYEQAYQRAIELGENK